MFKQSVNQLIELRSLYSSVTSHEFHFSNKSPDNCCITKCGNVVLLRDVEDEGIRSGFVLELYDDLYHHPYQSRLLEIGIYKLTPKKLENIIISRKALCIRKNDDYIVIPLL